MWVCQSNDSMYKTLTQAAAQETAFKAVIEELTRELALHKQQKPQAAEVTKPLDEAHATFESLFLSNWGPATQLDSIAELETGTNSQQSWRLIQILPDSQRR